MKEKILVTPRSFGKNMPELFEMLEQVGYEVKRNTTGAILDQGQMREMLADCVGVIIGVDPLNAEILACAPYPVSYTHLDVYKRQDRWRLHVYRRYVGNY